MAKAKAATKKSPPQKASPDWDAIHRDYSSGQFTSREVAAKHGNVVSHSTITRRAQKEGWTQNLAEPIRRATDAAVIRETVAALTGEEAPKALDTVLAAAELNKRVILEHRTELQRTRAVATALLQELSGSALLAEHMDVLAAILAGKDPEPGTEAQARLAVQKALGITTRIGGIKGLAEALTRLHAAERIAFSLDAPAEERAAGSMAALLDRMKRSTLPVQSELPAEGAEE